MDLTLLLKIFLLSFVQGVSEFFPISSSGHLVIFQELIGFKTIPLVYDIFFHIGTLISVLLYFFKDILSIAKGIREKENIQFISLIIVASIPTGMIGLFFKEQLEGMFTKPGIVGYFLLATAFIIFISKFISIKRPNIYVAAFIIGLFQGIAIIPGLSRSGLTISVGLILSMGFIFSFRFSFLLSIPAIIGALILEIDKVPFDGHHIFYLLTGTVFSAIFGLIALYFLKKIILKEKFHYFSYYCVFAGLAVLLFFN
ncbi:MAG: undecaprenyl-diphosphate phosphatase [Candidatus Aminicenantes bacterium]|nr:undecaprenyl-diphosphate phosphatase [Candidatus Aminicenantes bacterium]